MLAISVLFGVFFGSYRSLRHYEWGAETVFYSGVDGDGLCVSSDLNTIANEGKNMLTVAGRYLSAEEESVSALDESILSFLSAEGINQKIERYHKVVQNMETLAGRLEEEALSDKDSDYISSQLAEAAARERTARLDGYNDVAKEYNDQLTGFGGLMAKLYRLEPLATFR